MKKQFHTGFFLFMVVFVVTSCSVPVSKERYLINFERFVRDVEKNAADFSQKDWRWANKRFRLYSGEWYEKFSDGFTVHEELKIAGLKIRYQATRKGNSLRQKIDEDLARELERIGDDTGRYIDKNLEQDLEKLSKGAREIGDSARKVIDDLIRQIRKDRD